MQRFKISLILPLLYYSDKDFDYNKKILSQIRTKVEKNKNGLANSVCKFFEKDLLPLPSDIIHKIICYVELDDLAVIGRGLFGKGLQSHSQVEINEEVSILGIAASSGDSSDVTTM